VENSSFDLPESEDFIYKCEIQLILLYIAIQGRDDRFLTTVIINNNQFHVK